jgi:ferric iron reductase protein FhuF
VVNYAFKIKGIDLNLRLILVKNFRNVYYSLVNKKLIKMRPALQEIIAEFDKNILWKNVGKFRRAQVTRGVQPRILLNLVMKLNFYYI